MTTKSRYLVGVLCLTALSSGVLAGPASAQKVQIPAYMEPERGDHRDPRWDQDRTPDDGSLEGGCVGGPRCGGSRSEIRIPLGNSPIRAIRFQAHDNVGDKSQGRLRVLIDDRVLGQDFEVAKYGSSWAVPANGIRGRYLIFKAAADDEVMVETISIDYGKGRR
jgi:hypothetical protein